MSPHSSIWRRNALRALAVGGVLAIGVPFSGATAHAEPTAAQLEAQIREKSSKLSKVVEQYNRIGEEQKKTKAEIAALERALLPMRRQADEARADVADLAGAAYRTGGLTKVNALLAGGQSRAVFDRIQLLGQLAENEQAQIAAVQSATDRHQAAARRLDDKLADEAERAKALQGQKKDVEAALDKLYDLREQAYGSSTSGGSRYTGTIPSVSGKAGVAVTYAYNAIGTPYVWAADGPDGYDCSGLTLAAWRAAGVSLPHNAAMQWDVVAHISRSQLAAGDLVFYSGLGHVGIYVGSGNVIHAPTFGETVKISSVDMMPPYGYGRVRS